MPDFPIPFTGRLALKGGDLTASPSFVVAGMFTSTHRELAMRLATSLEPLRLPFAIYEVPTVHCSMSPKGTDDHTFSKANFIRFVLDQYRVPVLYVDCDCVFRTEPRRVGGLIAEGCDFAVYNWLADEHTDAFKPCAVSTAVPESSNRPRFYQFAQSCDWYAPDQLFCSGAVQFYAPGEAARTLLAAWSRTIRDNPGVPDDECLDFAFNFRRSTAQRARWSWLDKAYARYLFWIYVRPVIDHPQLPALRDQTAPKIERWKTDHFEKRADARLFPRDAVIDAEKRLILRPRNAGGEPGRIELAIHAPLHVELFL